MATVIDALLVTLGLDSSGFKKGAAEAKRSQADMTAAQKKHAKEMDELNRKENAAREKRQKEINEQNKQTTEGLRKIRNQALTVAALFTGGLGMIAFAKNTIVTSANLGRMSANLGMSVKDIIGWQRAAENAGYSSEGMANSLRKSSGAIGQFKSGLNSPLIQGFLTMGGSISGSQLSSAQSFELAQASLIQNLIKKQGEQKTLAQAQQWMGMSPEEFNFLKQGPALIQKQVIQQAALAAQTQKSAEQSAELIKKWNTFKNTLNDTSVTVLNALLPVFDKLLIKFQELATWVDGHKDQIAAWVDKTATAIGDFAKNANDAAQAVGGWKTIFEALVAIKTVSLIARLGAIASAITGIGMASAASSARMVAFLANPWLIGAGSLLYSQGLNPTNNANDQDFPDKPGAAEWRKQNLDRAKIAASTAALKQKSDFVVKRLMAHGFTREQAVAFAASMQQESSFNPRASNAGHLGIAQWDKSRQAGFLKTMGFPVQAATLGEQVDYAAYEIRHRPEWKAMMANKNDLGALNSIITRRYEAPGNYDQEIPRRLAIAQGIYKSSMGVPSGSMLSSGSMASNNMSSTTIGGNSSEVHIGKIEVHTQAKDANAIAAGMAPAIQSHLLPAQANSGLN